MDIRRVCVFCGSRPGGHPDYARAAREVGAFLAKESIGLVYGGSKTGLMGEVADAALEVGGEVIGVIPGSLQTREIAHTGLTDLRVVGTMHERKATMAALADAFLALPGGIGTFEEFFEMATWTQLGLQAKPTALLDVRGYYQGMGRLLDHAVSEGFLRVEQRALITISGDLPSILEAFRAFRPTDAERGKAEGTTADAQ
jgi:uncharacterized protein (TIGR00730 family)